MARRLDQRPAPGCTSSPSRQCTRATVPSRGARTGSSIFIASSTIRMSPRCTASPGATLIRRTVAGIGAVRASPALPLRRAPAARAAATSNCEDAAVEEDPARRRRRRNDPAPCGRFACDRSRAPSRALRTTSIRTRASSGASTGAPRPIVDHGRAVSRASSMPCDRRAIVTASADRVSVPSPVSVVPRVAADVPPWPRTGAVRRAAGDRARPRQAPSGVEGGTTSGARRGARR